MYKVLIVEDEQTVRNGLMRYIRWEDYGCELCGGAKNGVEGLSMIRSLRPDIVLTDLKMPSMTGMEMLAHAMGEHTLEAVIISGYGDFDLVRQALHTGVVDYLLKPVDREELIAVLKKIVANLDLKQKKRSPEPVSQGLSHYTHAALRFISANYQGKLTAAQIASDQQISTDHLGRVFKKEMGRTLREYITDFRIEKACAFFEENSNLKVYEVAELVGFQDYKYFHRVFTAHVGISPTEYREKTGVAQ